LTGLTAVLAARDWRFPSLEDVIRMKQAAGRPKDRIEIEVLGALRDEVERGGS